MRVFCFHLMSWPYLPAGYNGPAWVTCPNKFYDPEQGHRLYNEYMDLLEHAETLGFDGVCVNEHHQNAYGNMPSPNLIAAALARSTRKVLLAVIGNALPLYNPPVRVAEEYAMIDVISGGRLIAGFVVGGGPEYFSYGINPTQARERFQEAHDLIVRAWTEPGPFTFHGKHTRLKYVNIWPRPLQQPHPPIWVPGAGSIETIEWVAKRRYSYMGIPYFHIDVFRKTMAAFREACQKEGYEADPEQMGFPVGVYISDTDQGARREAEEHTWYFVRKLMNGLGAMPPGYTSASSLMRMAKARDKWMPAVQTWEELMEGGYIFAGSAATVIERLSTAIEQIGCGNLLFGFQFGSMPTGMVRRSMERFAALVLPELRKRFGEKLKSRRDRAAVVSASSSPTSPSGEEA